MKTAIFISALVAAMLVACEGTRAQTIDDVVSIEISSTRDKVYLNEQFQLTLSITSSGINLDSHFELNPSSMPDKTKLICGDFKSELAPERALQGNQIREKRRFITDARAIATGTLEIKPVVRIYVISGSGFFRQISQFDVKAKPLSLTVLPLPETGRPAEFSGAIGDFTMDIEAVPADVAIGDLITVTTRISGTGYLDSIPAINISPGANFKAYPARKIQDTEQGGKMFEQVLVPQNANATSIPPVSFCFFDPTNSAYKTVSKGPFIVTFHPQRKAPTETIYRPSGQKPTQRPSILQNKLTSMQGSFKTLTVVGAAYWLIAAIAAFSIAAKRKRGTMDAIGIIILAVILFLPFRNAAARYLDRGNIAVLIRSEKARIAPAFSAVISFNIQCDSAVQIMETYGTW